jgi:hypothetical protein
MGSHVLFAERIGNRHPYFDGDLQEIQGLNYLPWVSQGTYGGVTAKEIANYKASWGLMASLPVYVQPLADVMCMLDAYRGSFLVKDYHGPFVVRTYHGPFVIRDFGGFGFDTPPRFTVN